MKMTCIQTFTCKFTSAVEHISDTRTENLVETDVKGTYEEMYNI